MPIPLIVGAGLAAAGLAGSWISNKSANAASYRMQKQQFQNDLKMWQLNNEYNSPSAQLQRYQDAGLNPRLIYGSGTASAGNSSSYPHMQQFTPRTELDVTKATELLGVLSQFMQFKMQDAQTDNIKAATNLTNMKAMTEGVNAKYKNELWDLTGYKKMTEMYNSGIAEHNLKYTDQMLTEKLQGLKWLNELRRQQSIINPELGEQAVYNSSIKKSEAELKKLELEMQQSLKQYNLTGSDDLWARLAAKLLHSLGFDF